MAAKIEERDPLMQARLEKLDRLRSLGINPYPYTFRRSCAIADILKAEEDYLAKSAEVALAGRLVAFRRQGATTFANLKQDDARIQLYLNKDILGEQAYEAVKCLDIGDFIGINGVVFKTQRGETSVKVTALEVMGKSIRALPVPKEKIENGQKIIFDEFKDVETRYRQRYVDLVLNDEVSAVFRKRTAIIRAIRNYLEGHGYFEVETPVLQPIYGGANARPFTTHHNALDMTLYLRVSNELYLKRCIVGGIERVFEFSRNFRNEGIDRTHCPEFTILEFYQSYADYRDMMCHFENIYAAASMAVNGTTKISYQGTELDLTPPWERLTMKDALRRYAQIEVDSLSDDQIRELLKRKDIEIKGAYLRGTAVSELFEAYCEEKLIQPVFIIDHPRETTPLCKVHREDASLCERFEPYINGWEIGNAYSELSDPVAQRELLIEQVERGRGGEDETHPMDEDFIRALEYGMPPTGGVGIGIDRMVMLLTDQRTIRDVMLFPLLRDE